MGAIQERTMTLFCSKKIKLEKVEDVQLPAFLHYRHKFQQLISKDIKRTHNLHKFSERIQNNSLIFHNVSNVVLDKTSKIITADNYDPLITSRFSHVSWWIA